MATADGSGASMAGKTVVVTGGTSGLGAVAAEVLAARGARIVLIARDRARTDQALTRLRAANPAADHRAHLADLSSIAEMKRVAAAVAAEEKIVHVLANNAGALYGQREVTADGLERTFATNHLAYFVVTLGLKDALAAAGNARVVSTSSAAHRGARFDAADLQTAKGYSPFKAYGRSKLDNILFTRELARRWAGLGITANSFHPGVVATRFGDETGGWMGSVFGLVKRFAVTPEKGARTLVYLASAPEVAGTTGEYFEKCAVAVPRPAARDDAAAAILWAESLKLSGLSDAA